VLKSANQLSQDSQMPPKRFLSIYRRYKFLTAYGVLLMGTSAASYIVVSQISLKLPTNTLTIAIGVTFLLGLGIVLMNYLRGDSAERRPPIFYGGGFPETSSPELIEYELAHLKSNLAAIKADRSSLGQNADAITQLRAAMTSEILVEVERKLSAEALAKTQVQDIRAAFANSYARLAQALSGLNRRGNLNLVIGVITTVLAAALLAYMVLIAPAFKTAPEILGHYIPRLSTIIFIEVFSFFFLRLYKATLADSKFYQIELLALAAIDIALQAAMKSGDTMVMASVISQIAANKRNAVADDTPKTTGEVDVKGLADVLGKFAKIAVEASKVKS
jgi:hypothetical protein